jgi:glucose-6-phosphate 1-epimerase
MEPTSAIAELNRKFGIPGIAEVVAGNGGLPKVHITSAAAIGDIYLHGAHVTSWRPSGAEEVLFLSSSSKWEDGKAIRGGVPISFPWFADKANDPKAPAHGFVRTKSWLLDSIAADADVVTVTMSTASDESTKRWWLGDFRVVYRASFGRTLKLELEIRNTGATTLRFEEALHAYFKVGDVRTTCVRGLNNVDYLDKTDHYQEKIQQGDVEITSETDRVYLDTESPVQLSDAVLHRRLDVAKQNSRTTVIWNPWSQKAATMSDLGNDQWTQMLCIEASNVPPYAIEVATGACHRMSAVITTLSDASNEEARARSLITGGFL